MRWMLPMQRRKIVVRCWWRRRRWIDHPPLGVVGSVDVDDGHYYCYCCNYYYWQNYSQFRRCSRFVGSRPMLRSLLLRWRSYYLLRGMIEIWIGDVIGRGRRMRQYRQLMGVVVRQLRPRRRMSRNGPCLFFSLWSG